MKYSITMVDKKKSTKKKTGGSVLSDLTALTVPFGLIAAKDTLEKFIINREKELRRFEKSQQKKQEKTSSTKNASKSSTKSSRKNNKNNK